MTRIDEFVECFGKLDATNCSSETAIAQQILRNLWGYRISEKNYNRDLDIMVDAIQAYARLLQNHDVRA